MEASDSYCGYSMFYMLKRNDILTMFECCLENYPLTDVKNVNAGPSATKGVKINSSYVSITADWSCCQ